MYSVYNLQKFNTYSVNDVKCEEAIAWPDL